MLRTHDNKVWKRHLDQIRSCDFKRQTELEESNENKDTGNVNTEQENVHMSLPIDKTLTPKSSVEQPAESAAPILRRTTKIRKPRKLVDV